MTSTTHPTDAEILTRLMQEKGTTQADVCRGTGINPSVFCAVLKGRLRLKHKFIPKVAKFFGVGQDQFAPKRRGRSAAVRQEPKRLAKHGPDGAPWCVYWRDVGGSQCSKNCGTGPEGRAKAEELKRRIEEEGLPSFPRRKRREDRPPNRIPTPAGLALVSDDDRKRLYRDAEGREWCNARWTGLARKALQTGERGTVHLSERAFTISSAPGGETIYLVSEIGAYKQSVQDRAEGVYNGETIMPGEVVQDDCLTRGAIMRKYGVSHATVVRMEDRKLLKPKRFESKGGGSKNGHRIAYPRAEVEPVVGEWQAVYGEKVKGSSGRYGGGFPGVWADGRLSVPYAAGELGVPRCFVDWLVRTGKIPAVPRKPPAPYRGKQQATVLPGDVRAAKKWLKEWYRVRDAEPNSESADDVTTGSGVDDSATRAPEVANTPDDNGGPAVEGSSGTPLSKVERAMQIYLRDTNQSVREVARKVPCNPSLLFNSEKFMRLRAASQGSVPKGSKSKDGRLEAEEPEPE